MIYGKSQISYKNIYPPLFSLSDSNIYPPPPLNESGDIRLSKKISSLNYQTTGIIILKHQINALFYDISFLIYEIENVLQYVYNDKDLSTKEKVYFYTYLNNKRITKNIINNNQQYLDLKTWSTAHSTYIYSKLHINAMFLVLLPNDMKENAIM